MRTLRWLTPALCLSACAHSLNGECPTVDSVANPSNPDQAAAVPNAQPAQLLVLGQGFELLPDGLDGTAAFVPEATLELDDERIDAEVVYVSDQRLDLSLDPQTPYSPGLYDLVVTNPNGCSDRLREAVEVRENTLDDSIAISEVIPPFGWTEAATAVTILGAGFESTPRAWLSVGAHVRDWELDQVAFIDATSLTAIAPSGLPVGGPYDLIVENPDGGYNLLEAAFLVTEDAPPNILSLTPEAGETQDDTPVVIGGENFAPDVQVSLFDADGTEVVAVVTSAAATQIQATFPTRTELSAGVWIVRATNPDQTWDQHAAFVVRNPSAKLGSAGSWALSQPMAQARVGHGLAATTDALGRGFLYAVGGSDGTSSLATVERVQADAFGTLGSWQVLPTSLSTARAHGAVFEQDGWLYAVGGEDGSGPTDTVERARILIDASGARPEVLDALVDPGAGSLPSGAWYYRVSATMAANHPENPGGETPASRSYVVWADADSAVTLTWTTLAGASGYRVYRTDGPNGAAGAEHLVADGLVDPLLVDDGLPAGTAGPIPDGGLGTWTELASPMPGPWSHGALAIAADPSGKRWVYTVGGWDGTALLADVYALDPATGTWATAATLATPRADNMATVAGPAQAENLGAASPTFLIALEGETAAGVSNDIVFAEVLAGGALGPWSDMNRLNAGGQSRMDGEGLAAAGHLYIVGGARDPIDAESSCRQAEIQGPGLDMGSWSSSSASGTLQTPRADFGMVHLRATLYASGGRTDVETASATVEQVSF